MKFAKLTTPDGKDTVYVSTDGACIVTRAIAGDSCSNTWLPTMAGEQFVIETPQEVVTILSDDA